jgi:hypothetical protein
MSTILLASEIFHHEADVAAGISLLIGNKTEFGWVVVLGVV